MKNAALNCEEFVVNELIKSVDTFVATLPQERRGLGPIGESEPINSRGYFVRRGNGTIYPTVDRSILVRVETEGGCVGWGETYGICAPKAVCEIIQDLLVPFLVGRSAVGVQSIWEYLYDMMRVRGFYGGFYLDAIAAIDIALWDIAGKEAGKPLYELLGGKIHTKIPAYISGLPRKTVTERAELAADWASKGFSAVKFAASVCEERVLEEMRAIRDSVGPECKIMSDFHWKYSAAEAIQLVHKMDEFNLTFVEAPVKPEDIRGLSNVARAVPVPVAAGEEWRTVYEARQRLDCDAISIIQPEMGHTGVTQFTRMARMAEAFHVSVAPHATIGVGIFMAASLHASASLNNLLTHEYQHTIFDRNTAYLSGELVCREGFFNIPEGTGIGVEPNNDLLKMLEPVS